MPVGKGARTVEVRLDGVPGLDLVLELYDSQGRPIAKGDAHGRGGGEWLQPTSIGPTEAFVAVRELWVSGQKPTEDPNEAYELVATWGAPAVGWEIEPNDWEQSATPNAPGTSMRGYLGRPDDKDWFTVMPGDGGDAARTSRCPTASTSRSAPTRRASKQLFNDARANTHKRQSFRRQQARPGRGRRAHRRGHGGKPRPAGCDAQASLGRTKRTRRPPSSRASGAAPYELRVDIQPK